MSQPALLIIDLLNDYFHDDPLRSQKNSLVNSVNQLIHVFRANHLPIIWVRQEFSPDLSDAFPEMKKRDVRITIAGTEGAKLLSGLEYRSSDFEVIKKRYSAFFQTNLDDLLLKIKANPIVIAGVNTHACIRTAAIDAYQRDFEIILARDCVSSYDEEHHRVSLKYMDGKIAQVLSNSQIESLISKPKQPYEGKILA